MPDYNVIKLDYDGHEHTFYGVQDDHNHAKANAFTIAAVALMAAQYRCRPNQVNGTGTFRSHQSEPSEGNELKWESRTRKWVQK